MRHSLLACAALAAASLASPQPAQAQLDARAVATYESAGLYWSNPPGATLASGCQVRFRRVGAIPYTQGLDMWFDAATNECRGSLVHLAPDTSYEAEMSVSGAVLATRLVVFRTWANTVPILRTQNVPSGSAQLNVTSGGSPAGYVVYQGAPGVLDGNNAVPYNIYVQASYVVIRGFTLRGAQQHAIRIAHNVTDVIVEDNDISGWGRGRGGNLGVNADSGIYAFCHPGAVLTRVTIQRNEIYNPRYASNSWSDGHPAGPQGITMELCPGNHVIRHNEIFSTNGNYFNDGISGADNVTATGFPNADSDIYGNEVSNTWDDAIEVEGGNRNVRVWGNYMDRTGTGIASTITSVGPLYLFRNVYNRSRFLANVPPDQDDRQTMFKAGSDAAFANGRRYVFHNTMLQATEAGSAFPLGAARAVGGTASNKPLRNTVTRNNIWHVWKSNSPAFYEVGPDNDAGWDLYSGTAGTPIVNGIRATPAYAPGHGWQSESGGLYQLASGTPGFNQGTRLANFNDGYSGSAPDIGAHEGGTPAMKFGIAASSGPAVPGGGGPPGAARLVLPRALDFGGQSMCTRSPARQVTVTNDSLAAITVTNVSVSGPFTRTHGCGLLAPLASCVIDVVFAPPIAAGALNARVAHSGTLTITSTDAGSPRAVPLAGAAEKSLVSHYYRSILRRAPDPAGQAFWEGEADRMQRTGVDLNEAWFAMAMGFFASVEYTALGRSNADYLTDLYNTFFNRAPDAGGLAFWGGELSRGLPREVVLAGFMFSPEFAAFTSSIFGNTDVRPEIDMIVDFYRGLLARLPDSQGFGFWLTRFRSAQCAGAGAVAAEADAISSAFMNGVEYNGRSRDNAEFVGDLYNAYLRRGGDLPGVQHWIGQLASGALGRNEVRLQFQASPEFAARVNAVAASGCV